MQFITQAWSTKYNPAFLETSLSVDKPRVTFNSIPAELIEFLRITDGGDGAILVYPHYLVFFCLSASSLPIISSSVPAESGLFVFATNAIGVYIAFDKMIRDPDARCGGRYELTIPDFLRYWNGYSVYRE